MLSELKNVNQEKVGYRRIFIGDYFDLFIWYDEVGGNMTGFELCYNKDIDEHSIIWKKSQGYFHSKVDSGEGNPSRSKQTPILMADGEFNHHKIAEKFKLMSEKLDDDIKDLVYQKLLNYGSEHAPAAHPRS